MSRPVRLALVNCREGASFLLAQSIGRLPSRSLRHALYRGVGMRLASDARIHLGLEVRHPRGVSIGPGSIIGFDAILDGRRGLSIGADVNLSSDVAIWTLQHDPDDPGFGGSGAPVRIGDRAWLSFRATILPGVTIGEGAVVAAGALVTSDVAPYAVVGGVPASQIGERSRDLRYELGSYRAPWFI